MRRALDGTPTITLGFGVSGWGYFGKHAGYDYGVVKWAVRAPEAGVITNVKIAPTADGGNIVELRSANYDHRFLHLDSISVAKGQQVAEGQQLGVSGNTGNVGYHLHHDVRKKGTLWTDSFSNYVNWEQIIKGENMNFTEEDVKGLLRILHSEIEGADVDKTHSGAFDAQLRGYVGKDIRQTVFNMFVSSAPVRAARKAYKDFYDANQSGYEPVKEQLFRKKP